MTGLDPNACRRSLRDISEIAAVATLQDSQMSGQEALQAIAAIADWIDDARPRDRAACGVVIHTLHALTDNVDFDRLDDRETYRLFSAVRDALNGTAGRAGP